MNALLRLISTLVVCAAPTQGRAGVVTPLSSNRFVTVLNRETLPQTTMSFTGPALGPWQATAYVINELGQPNANPFGSPTAVTSSQQSSFAADGVSFTGFVFIDYSGVVPPNLGVSATNRSDTIFHVEGDCSFQFQATFTSNNVSETQGSLFLRSTATSQNIFSLTASGSQSGILPTGDYTLSIVIQGNSGGILSFDGRTQIDALFTIPAPSTGLCILLAPLLLASRSRRPTLAA